MRCEVTSVIVQPQSSHQTSGWKSAQLPVVTQQTPHSNWKFSWDILISSALSQTCLQYPDWRNCRDFMKMQFYQFSFWSKSLNIYNLLMYFRVDTILGGFHKIKFAIFFPGNPLTILVGAWQWLGNQVVVGMLQPALTSAGPVVARSGLDIPGWPVLPSSPGFQADERFDWLSQHRDFQPQSPAGHLFKFFTSPLTPLYS